MRSPITQKDSEIFYLLRWKPKTLALMGVFVFLLTLLCFFYLDQRLALYLRTTFGKSLFASANALTWLGLGDGYFFVAIVGTIVSRYSKWQGKTFHNRFRNLFELMLMCFIISGVFLFIFKIGLGRERPYHTDIYDPLHFRPFSIDSDYQSFPSGHTQVGFTSAALFSYLWPRRSFLFFSLAILIALTRVILEYHYLSDTFAAAYIGVLGFYLTYHWFGHWRK